MIVKLFGGAGIGGLVGYITHDSPAVDNPHPDTSDRVGHTESIGLPDVDPEIMTRAMQGLMADRAFLKRRAGQTTRGRKLKEPYAHLILSYPPGVKPEIEQIRDDVRGALDAIGITNRHYGVMAVHTDKDHLHVHVAVSRIDPETGIAAKLGHSHPRLSKWAHEHERQAGRIVVPARTARWDRKPGDPYPTRPPRVVRDAIGRLITRSPEQNREWRALLTKQRAKQREEKTPKADGRRERVALARSQTRDNLERERKRIETRSAPAADRELDEEPRRPPRLLDRAATIAPRQTAPPATVNHRGPEPPRAPDLDRAITAPPPPAQAPPPQAKAPATRTPAPPATRTPAAPPPQAKAPATRTPAPPPPQAKAPATRTPAPPPPQAKAPATRTPAPPPPQAKAPATGTPAPPPQAKAATKTPAPKAPAPAADIVRGGKLQATDVHRPSPSPPPQKPQRD